MRFLLVFFLAFSPSLFAQSQIPRLVATMDDQKEPIKLSEMDVEVKILGEIAETRTTLTFFNPHSRVLEGNLYFPLPEGVTVSGYALDVNGVMVDGVVVEKHEARRVFEREERKGIDPGLVEWVKGNNFQTRVYPIPAEGTRTVMVRYLSELPRFSERTTYHIPLNFEEKIGQFHLRVEVIQAVSKPIVTTGSLADFSFGAWRDSYVAETTLKDVTLNEDLLIELPETEKTPVRVEKNADGSFYFVISDYKAAASAPKNNKSGPPKKITLFWDASGSQGKRNRDRELALLEKLFKQWDKSTVEVNLVLFCNEAEPFHRFDVANSDPAELLAFLRAVDYDGGTQMSVISQTAQDSVPDFYLLFTDGISNFGIEEPTGFKAPLYAITADPTANHSFLSHTALKTNGQYYNLSIMDDGSVLNSIGQPVYQFMRARYDSDSIRETYPQTPEPVHGRFILAGKLNAPKAEIRLEFGSSGRVQKVVKYTVRQESASEGHMVETLWAQKKIEELSVFPERNEGELIVTGKKYGLVTPGTSLLVLETLDQYLEYRIEPPETLPEMRDEYLGKLAEYKETEKRDERYKLERIVRLWNNRVKWWEKDFSLVKTTKKTSFDNRKPARSAITTPAIVRTQPPVMVQTIAVSSTPEDGGFMLSGYVLDESGGRLPGSTITVINIETESSWATLTNDNGTYGFPDLPIGTYQIRAELDGFQTRTYTDLPIENNENFRFDIELSVAGLEEEIRVSAPVRETVLLESNASVGISADQVNVQRDGVTVNNVRYAPGLVAPAADAEFGRGSGQVQFVTRSGSFIEIQGWNPEMPYLDTLKKADPEKQLQAYLQQRKNYDDSPAFFLDCANFFFQQGQTTSGLRILSNIAELQLDNPALLRILAHRLSELGEIELSIGLFETVLKMRPEEPQSYRDLALVLSEQKEYARAMELLNHVVMNQWDRFDEIEVIALMELNRIIPLAREHGITNIPLDPRLVQLLDVDVRIVLTWDADMTDIDLWVTEPTGEKAYYSNSLTAAGGLVSRDFTEGYGPEEYVIHKSVPGKYIIQVNYYGSESQRLQGPVTVQADVYTNYGRENEKRQRLTLRLEKEKDTYTVGEISF